MVTEDIVKRRIVTLGGADGDQVIITDGLKAGDKVVTKGNEGLSDGSKIQLPGKRPAGQTRNKGQWSKGQNTETNSTNKAKDGNQR